MASVPTQRRFADLKLDTSASRPPASAAIPFNSRRDASGRTSRGLASGSRDDQWSSFDSFDFGSASHKKRHGLLEEDEDHSSTPPIDVPAPSLNSYTNSYTNSNETAIEETGPTSGSRYAEPSPLEQAFRTRSTSITFSPHVTLDSGQQRGLEQPLPRPEKNRARGRSILQEMAERASQSPAETAPPRTLTRAHSESERAKYDPITGELIRLRRKGGPQTEEEAAPRYPLLYTAVEEMATDANPGDDERVASLTSDSTASPALEEISTPLNTPTEFTLSPLNMPSHFKQPMSLEESSAWPMPRRGVSMHRAKSYGAEKSATRRASRASSGRSTSSMSPASAFLSQWGRAEASTMIEPDDEGQEVGDYVLGKQIGFGGFSIVREAYTIEGDDRVRRAVKIVRKQVDGKSERENDQLQTEFEHEVSLWRCLSHRNILPLIAVYDTPFATFCFIPLIPAGTLFDLVRQNRKGLRPDLAKRYACQLACAIRYLHEDVHVVHRDIKLENCLLDMSSPNAEQEGGKVLLCDFGMAEFITGENRNSPDPYEKMADRPPQKNIGPSETSTCIVGSLQYASPESITEQAGLLSPPMDIWAYGVVLYALLVGDLPFQHMFQPKVRMMILRGDWDEQVLRNGNGVKGSVEEAVELVKRCLTMEPENRWEIGRVLDCLWLRGVQTQFEDAENDMEIGSAWT
ncbi:MAG: hypothetical protein M1819_000405 [Sarea resinae]|nr:MAG: hypothetical protein M1819_000405 [Sarea resinae]